MPCRNHPDVNDGLVRCTRCSRLFCRDCVIQLRGFYYCGGCKGEHVRDVQSGTAPGTLDLATVGRRWGGSIVDTLALYTVYIPVSIGFGVAMATFGGASKGSGGETLGGALVILLYGVLLGIPVVYEGLMVSSRGQTLGKMAVGIKIVNPDGSAVSPGQAWGRAVVKMALGTCAGITFLPALFTKDRTTIHDMVAKTRVVRVQR
jgi:uncharacterized RDD family membrane protein YckC